MAFNSKTLSLVLSIWKKYRITFSFFAFYAIQFLKLSDIFYYRNDYLFLIAF